MRKIYLRLAKSLRYNIYYSKICVARSFLNVTPTMVCCTHLSRSGVNQSSSTMCSDILKSIYLLCALLFPPPSLFYFYFLIICLKIYISEPISIDWYNKVFFVVTHWKVTFVCPALQREVNHFIINNFDTSCLIYHIRYTIAVIGDFLQYAVLYESF